MRRSSFALSCAALAASGSATPAFARRAPAPSPTPVPTPLPTETPLSEELRLERLPHRLEAIAQNAPGTLGVSVHDLYRDTHVAVRGDRPFPLADVFKLAVAVTAFRLADAHKIGLDTQILITAADLRHGTSPIAEAHPRGNVTLPTWQLARAMLVDSDNTACDAVLAAVGGPAVVQNTMTDLGIAGWHVSRTEADLYADAEAKRTFAHGGDNGGTPDGVVALLTAIATQRALFLDTTNELLLALGDSRTGANRLHAGLPATARLAHKTGTSYTIDGIVGATNDAGIVTLPDGRRVIVVAFLADSTAADDARDAVLASVARAVYETYVA